MKKPIFLTCIFIISMAASAQLPSVGKAKSLLGSKSNNNQSSQNSSGNTTTPSTGNNAGTTTSSNNSTTTTSNSNGNSTTTPASNNNVTTGSTNKKSTVSKPSLISITFTNASGQKATDYKDGDVITARIDFTGTMKDIGGAQYSNGNFVVGLYDGNALLNGTLIAQGETIDYLKDEDLSKPYFEFQVMCSPKEAKYPVTGALLKTMKRAKLSKTIHTIKITLQRSDKVFTELPVAEGTFTLDLTNGDDKLKAEADAFDAIEVEKRRMPEAVMRNASIERDMMNIVQYDFSEKVIPLRAVIAESDWEILRNDYGAITGRKILGYVAFKVARNGVCFYEGLTIYQPYTGGGKYGLSKYYEMRPGSAHIEIGCENVMK